jgi:hypothetical protein
MSLECGRTGRCQGRQSQGEADGVMPAGFFYWGPCRRMPRRGQLPNDRLLVLGTPSGSKRYEGDSPLITNLSFLNRVSERTLDPTSLAAMNAASVRLRAPSARNRAAV